MKIQFTIMGNPIPQGRPRFAKQGICYARDQPICESYQRKEYAVAGRPPGVLITIEEIEEEEEDEETEDSPSP